MIVRVSCLIALVTALALPAAAPAATATPPEPVPECTDFSFRLTPFTCKAYDVLGIRD